MCLCLGVGFVGFILKQLGTVDFVRCDMNDVTIPHALCIEKNIVYYVISFREGEPQCGDPEHRITLCEINSIKNDNIAMPNVKLTLVGDSSVGKSRLISYIANSAVDYSCSTVLQNYTGTLLMDDNTFCLEIKDTAGVDDYDRLHPLSYPQTDVFMLCYSIESRDSFENIESKWIPEIRRYCPDTAILLVACKIDKRSTSSHVDLITTEEGHTMANKLGMSFCETSAETKAGQKECFEAAVKCTLDNQKALKRKAEKNERKMKIKGGKCSIV